LNVRNEGVNVNGVKATKRKKSGKRKRSTANKKCSENGEVIVWCTVGHRERGCKEGGRVRGAQNLYEKLISKKHFKKTKNRPFEDFWFLKPNKTKCFKNHLSTPCYKMSDHDNNMKKMTVNQNVLWNFCGT